MAKWIKNNTGGDKTWVGQLVSASSYYEIQEIELYKWQNDSLVLTDIASGDAIVAKDDSGNNDIIDIAFAINFLKNINDGGTSTNPYHIYALAEGNTLRARLVGIFNQTVTKNQTTNLDWVIPQTSYLGVNKQSFMDGIQLFAKDAEVGDKIKLQVVDVNGLLYPAGTVLDEFGTDWAVIPNEDTVIRLYKAKLIPGFYIRVIYTSIGTTNDIKLVCNLFRHMDTA